MLVPRAAGRGGRAGRVILRLKELRARVDEIEDDQHVLYMQRRFLRPNVLRACVHVHVHAHARAHVHARTRTCVHARAHECEHAYLNELVTGEQHRIPACACACTCTCMRRGA